MQVAKAQDPIERVNELLSLVLKLRGISDWKELLEIAEEAEQTATQAGYEIGVARSKAVRAFADYFRGDFGASLRNAHEAHQELVRLDDKEWVPEALVSLYLTQWSLGNYDVAFEVGLECMRLYEENGNISGLAWSYTAAGGLAHDLGDHKQALELHTKSLPLFREIGSTLGEGRALAGLGLVYQTQGDHIRAMEVQQQALDLFRKIGNLMGESRALNDIGTTYQLQGKYEEALSCHQKALAIREKVESPSARITSLLNIGKVQRLRGESEEARSVLERGLQLAIELGLKPKLFQAHFELSQLFEAAQDHRAALEHFKAFHRVRDEVFSEETNTRLKNLQAGFETERSRREAEIYRLRNVELAQALEQLQEAQAQLLQTEKMAALGDLVAGVAHELNSPLGVILSSTRLNESVGERLAAADVMGQPKVRKLIETALENNSAILRASERIHRIVQSLKGFARLDEAEYQQTDIHRGIEETLTLLEPTYRDHIRIKREYGDIGPVYCYAAEMNQVFGILLRNAIEAIDGDGVITISTVERNGRIEITFADTGRGIPGEQLPRLFNPSFRKTGARVEARMGLFAALHVVNKHRGEIKVESELGKGTRFTILISRGEER